jgi:hypothetical protein
MAKVAILLRSPLYPDHSRITEALVYCCNIHGCPLDAIPEFTIDEFNCSEPEHLTNHYEYVWKQSGKYRDNNVNWINPPHVKIKARTNIKNKVINTRNVNDAATTPTAAASSALLFPWAWSTITSMKPLRIFQPKIDTLDQIMDNKPVAMKK